MGIEGKRIVLFARNISLCEYFYMEIASFFSIQAIITDNYKEYLAANRKTVLPICYIERWDNYNKEHNYIICCYITEEDRFFCDAIMDRAGLFFDDDYTDALYVLSLIRRKFETDWTEREVWIFGAGNNGKRFYKNCMDCGIEIAGFLSNFEDEEECQGLPVVRPCALDQQKEPYIVICSDAWREMRDELERLGFEGVKDYCFADWIPKKMFVAIGPCQIRHTTVMLWRNNRFMAKWDTLIVYDTVDDYPSAADKKRMFVYGKVCDAVFYRRKSLGDEELPDNGQYIIEKYYQNAKKIGIPFYYFRGQHMQASQTVNPYTVREIKKKFYFWFRGDQEINRLIDQGYSVEEIVNEVSDISYWTEDEIRRNFAKELHKVKVLDRLSSIKIGDFIENHYQEFPVFRDGTHFGMELTLFIVNEISSMLGITPFSEDEAEKAVSETGAEWKNVMPIYPCVAEALQIRWRGYQGFYQIVKIDSSIDWVDFREYVRRYAEFVYSVKKIISEYGSVF